MKKRINLTARYYELKDKFKQINDFFSKVEIKYNQLSILILLSLLASLFDAFSIGLLIPVLKGVIEGCIDENQIILYREIIIYLKKSGVFSEKNLLFVLTGLIFIAAVIHQLLEYSARIKTCNISRNSTHKLRQLILSKYLKFGKTFFDNNNYSYLQTLILDFPEKIFNLFILLRKYLTFFFVQFFYFILILLISWKMTVFLLIAFLILHMGILRIYKSIQQASKRAIHAIKQINQKVYNILTCMPLIKVYHQEEYEYQAFSAQSKSIANIEIYMDKKSLL
ncbi:membrane protein containing ABC transporter, transmembrane region domain protein, partial [Candidatus Magnetomorum sp. HK-1]